MDMCVGVTNNTNRGTTKSYSWRSQRTNPLTPTYDVESFALMEYRVYRNKHPDGIKTPQEPNHATPMELVAFEIMSTNKHSAPSELTVQKSFCGFWSLL